MILIQVEEVEGLWWPEPISLVQEHRQHANIESALNLMGTATKQTPTIIYVYNRSN